MPQPRFANSSSSITAWCTAAAQPGIVTFTWTKPVKTQEIVLPSALTYIIYVIQCLGQTERSSGTWQGDCSPHPHTKTSLQTRLKWPQVCTRQVCSHTYAKTVSPSPVCCQDSFKHTHRRLAIAPLLSPAPPPSSKLPTPGACACESGRGLSSPHRCAPSSEGSEGNESFRSSL